MSFPKGDYKNIKLIEGLARRAILDLVPYSSARSEYVGKSEILLDANENTFGSAVDLPSVCSHLNRYPDPLQIDLRNKLAKLYKVNSNQIFVGNGSDEAIDLLLRVFCEPGKDAILITPPTYGMYEVIANVQGVLIQRANLSSDFTVDYSGIKKTINSKSKIVFICSPNNPTGNKVEFSEIVKIAKLTAGILVVDEAYIDFAEQDSAISLLQRFPNIVVLRTLSKAWGMAGIRTGFAIAHPRIISLLQKIKFPYNVSSLSQATALRALDQKKFLSTVVAKIKTERARLSEQLSKNPDVVKVFPSDASFILVKFKNSNLAFNKLNASGIIVRDRNNTKGCENCLRISIGTREENNSIIACLNSSTNSNKSKKIKKVAASE